ncbi:hypothetical protein HXX76_001137 [Chlamydomonas incerta]|uniref:Uncharacterized protein n=1 Tax=Chlamydomonas incerta TaxID=51695 RepID=A0A836B0W8_CHLIN|nr:hypothetical protein HXX76_001137 [Chlamydomonas incerta]|eukprot:KAG2444381.1 hypothetical protein HXX76_001137 [Chlamydomonas incerta]
MAHVSIVAASAAALTASLAGLAGLAGLAQRRDAAERSRARSSRAGGGAVDEFEDDNVNLAESASVWLARRGSSQIIEPQTSSYDELELLADGEFVYFRKDTEVLTAIPPCKVLQLQPLQLTKGRSDAVPTAPLEPNSVWLVLRKKQEVVFMLLGSDHQRHVLEADPQSANGVTLGGGAVKKRGRWTITPQGLASAAWPEHMLPLQVLTVQLVDARAVGSVKAAMARKLNELASILDGEAHHRAVAETRSQQLELELRRVKDEVASQVAELRAQLDAAVRGRHVAEREVASLQGQKADEAVRAKMAQARAAQAEFEAQQAAANVKGLQQQIQGMLAGHSEELRTLQHELQFAREANDALKRAMSEQVMALQGALELRDARILELEEENERMDTVLQVIQAQLGQGGGAVAVEGLSAAVEQVRIPAEAAGAGDAEEHDGEAAAAAPTSQPGRAEEAQPDQPPLWKALLDSTGDISLTALKESLEVSRRSNPEESRPANSSAAPDAAPDPATQPGPVEERTAVEGTEPSTGPSVPAVSAAAGGPPDAQGGESAGPRAWPCTLSPDRSFSPMEGGGSGASSCGDAQAAAAASNSSSPSKQLQRQHSAAELEFGGAAVVTLDSLRRRMRALAAEYDRCAVLSQSLRESLPWRAAGLEVAIGGAGVLAAAAAAASGSDGLEPGPGSAADAASSDGGRGSMIGSGSRRSAAREVTSPTLAASSGRASWQASDPEEPEDGSERKRPRQSFGSRLEGILGSAEESCSPATAQPAGRPGRGSATGGPHREGSANGSAAPAAGPAASGARTTGSNVHRITQKLLAGSGAVSGVEAVSVTAPRGPRLGSHALVVADSLTSSTATLAGSPHSRSGTGSGDTDPSASASLQLSTPFASASAARASGQTLVTLRPSRSGSGAGMERGADSDATVSPPGFTVHHTPWSASASEEVEVPVGSAGCGDEEEHAGATSAARRISISLGGAAASRRDSAELRASGSSSSQGGSPGPESDSLSPLPAEDPPGQRSQANAAAAAGPAKPVNGLGGGGGRFVPELKLEGTRAHADAGVYESMEMCCLGSTRAFPTARNTAGALTARQVSHSRQASFGAHTAFTAAHDQLTPPLLSPAATVAGPGSAAVDADASARSPLVEDTQARGAGGAAGSTPKGAGTPPGGAVLDDDAVHCDDQEPSPPPPGGMLLGTLEQLRGGGGPGTTGKRAALAALEEDEEEEEEV